MTMLGSWTLVDVIGRGAAGTVWRATDFSRTVTAKIADPTDEKACRSLARERRVLGQLDHSTLPTLLDSFDDPPALVLDLPPSQTYGDLLTAGTLWSVGLGQRLDALSTVAVALDDLHAQGIVHRDVKPAHVTATVPPKLFDFGIAHVAGDPDAPDPDAGTAAYLPPPGEPSGPPRDAYAFAVMAYELLFGAHPLLTAADRDIHADVLRRRAADKLRTAAWRMPSRAPRAELPPDLRGADLFQLDVVFEAALGNPDRRPDSLRRWMNAVRACIPEVDELPAAAPDVMPQAFAAAHTAHEVAAALQTGDGAARRRISHLIVVALIALIAATLAALTGRL